jgi:hypothetical protein
MCRHGRLEPAFRWSTSLADAVQVRASTTLDEPLGAHFEIHRDRGTLVQMLYVSVCMAQASNNGVQVDGMLQHCSRCPDGRPPLALLQISEKISKVVEGKAEEQPDGLMSLPIPQDQRRQPNLLGSYGPHDVLKLRQPLLQLLRYIG